MLALWGANLYFFLKLRKAKTVTQEVAATEPQNETPEEDDAEYYYSTPKQKTVIADSQPTATATKQSNGDDEDEEESASFTVVENGNVFNIRYVKSFTAKLVQASDETKAFYTEIKNEILSYKKVSDKTSWHHESFGKGREPFAKFGMRGKTLCVYFPLDANEFAESKYKVETCDSKKYAAVPCMYRIKNQRRCVYAKELIAQVAEKIEAARGETQNATYDLPYEDTQALLAKGLIKELKTQTTRSVNVRQADSEMSDEVALTYVKNDADSKVHKGKKAIINVDTIGENFNDGDKVDVEALWEKNLVSKKVGYVKVLAKGTLDKKLDVELQDYSIQAVKMIVLEGGTVSKAK